MQKREKETFSAKQLFFIQIFNRRGKKIKVQNCPDLSKEIEILHNKYFESENIPEKIA